MCPAARRLLCTHRGSAVERVVGAELRVDGGVGLQDSGAHVQNGRGAVVQTVLQNKAGLALSVPHSAWMGLGPSSARQCLHSRALLDEAKAGKGRWSPAMLVLHPHCCCQHLPAFHPLLTSTFQFSLFLWKPRR